MTLPRKTAVAALALALALAPTPLLAIGGKGGTFSNQILALFFNGTAVPSIAQNNATTPATVLCVALHTADPGVGGTQSTNEAAYPGYARVGVPRTTAGWVVTGATVNPAATISFPQSTGGPETETFFSVAVPTGGSGCSGALVVMYRGSITPNLTINASVTPQLTASTALNEN